MDEIDPLLGWGWSDSTSLKRGYDTAYNCSVLKSTGKFPVKLIRIFVTGASTSDVLLKQTIGVNELQKLFNEREINAVFYCGAVCGYNSGQEFLKLIRDGSSVAPDIHTSYSGANDFAQMLVWLVYMKSNFGEIVFAGNKYLALCLILFFT